MCNFHPYLGKGSKKNCKILRLGITIDNWKSGESFGGILEDMRILNAGWQQAIPAEHLWCFGLVKSVLCQQAGSTSHQWPSFYNCSHSWRRKNNEKEFSSWCFFHFESRCYAKPFPLVPLQLKHSCQIFRSICDWGYYQLIISKVKFCICKISTVASGQWVPLLSEAKAYRCTTWHSSSNSFGKVVGSQFPRRGTNRK